MVTSMYMYMQEYLRTQDLPQYMYTKNLVSYGQTLFWRKVVYHLWYKYPAMPLAMVLYAT